MGRFLHNKYSKWYFNLMVKVENRTCLLSGEKHHIIPKSMGGSDDESNIALLTFREHFIAHRLLLKFCTTKRDTMKMMNALGTMQRKSSKHKCRILTARQFEITRSAYVSRMMGNTIRSGTKLSEEHKRKTSLSMIGRKRPKEVGIKISDGLKRSHANGSIVSPFKGRKHSLETRKKMSLSRRARDLPKFILRG